MAMARSKRKACEPRGVTLLPPPITEMHFIPGSLKFWYESKLICLSIEIHFIFAKDF